MKNDMNDKNILSRISAKVLKANRLRNTFAVIAIVLTTILFTSIFTVTASWLSSMTESDKRHLGTAAHGEFKYLTEEQYKTISAHPLIKDIGYSQIIGFVSVPGNHSLSAELRCASNEWVAGITYSKPTVGALPEKENEIALDTIMLEYLGVTPQLGSEVSITFGLGNEEKSGTFILSGFWEGDATSPASIVWVSKPYSDKLLKDYEPVFEEDPTGKYNAPVMFWDSKRLESKFDYLITDCGLGNAGVHFGINPVYHEVKIKPATVLMAVALLGMIVICGYLIISNVFSISIANDIHSYALYKIIGTTNKQLKRIVRKQVLFLCFIGIPLGLVTGYAVSCVVTPFTFRILNVSVTNISANPLIFVVTALFSAFTVFISTYRSLKLIKEVSPITALRSNESTLNKSKKVQKSILKPGKLNVLRLGFANVFRYKKKMFNVILSLAFSLILVNISYSLVHSFDMDAYISRNITCDYMIADSALYMSNHLYVENGLLNRDRVSDILSIEGIKESGSVYFSEFDLEDKRLNARYLELSTDPMIADYFKSSFAEKSQNDTFHSHIYALDEMLYEDIRVLDENLDWDLFETGDYVLVSPFLGNENVRYYAPGDTVELTVQSGKTKTYKVLGTARVPDRLEVGHSHLPNPEFILPSKEFKELTGNTASTILALNVTDSEKEEFEQTLSDYCENTGEITYVSRDYYKALFDGEKQMFVVIGLTLSLILGFIGIVNFMNSMITSIITRRREFALMQSIGMETKQLNVMIFFESLAYVFFTLLVVLTFGALIGKVAIAFVSSVLWYVTDHFMIRASIVCALLFIVFAGLISCAVFSNMQKKTVMEKLVTYD